MSSSERSALERQERERAARLAEASRALEETSERLRQLADERTRAIQESRLAYEGPRPFQLTLAASLSTVTLLSVLVLMAAGYEPSQGPPSLFVWCELVAVVVASVASGTWMSAIPALLYGTSSSEVPLWWKMTVRTLERDRFRASILALVTALQFAAVFILVHDTGGLDESPFAPLGIGLAVCGTLVTRKMSTLIAVLVMTAGLYSVLLGVDPAASAAASGWVFYAVDIWMLLVLGAMAAGIQGARRRT